MKNFLLRQFFIFLLLAHLFGCNNHDVKLYSVSFGEAQISLKEKSKIEVSITLEKPMNDTDTLVVEVNNITTDGSDYSLSDEIKSGIIKLPGAANTTTINFFISATYDSKHEDTESFVLKIKKVPGGFDLGSGGEVTVDILNNNLGDDLVGEYLFDGNANDNSENKLDGTVSGATLTTNRMGAENSAYYFDGSSYIEIADNELLNFDNNFTLAAWVNPSSFKTYGGRIIDKVVGSQGNGFLLDTYSQDFAGNKIRMMLGGNGWYFLSPTALETTQWYFVVATYSSGVGQIYINGELNVQNTSNATSIITSTTPMRFGFDSGVRTGPDFDDSFVGKLDDIRIYHRVLTSDEVSQLYNELNNQ